MKPTFIQPCFIRKNTPDLRRKLEELGYYSRAAQPKMDGSNSGVLFCNKDRYSEIPYGHPEEINRTIDCGTNEDLFLAVAALRSDSDKFQWFTDGENWILSYSTNWDDYDEDDALWECDPDNYHKATVEELIEHFK